MRQPQKPEWVTKKDYAEHHSVSERTVERWESAGLIYPLRLGLGKRPIKRYNKNALPRKLPPVTTMWLNKIGDSLYDRLLQSRD